MNSIQKFFTICCLTTAMTLLTNNAFASDIPDVPNGYWAEKAIVYTVQQDYISLKGNNYQPQVPITRAEFANAVYKLLKRSAGMNNASFKDVNNQTKYNKSILSLNELRVIFGYPDGNFKPQQNLKRSEASSVAANIIRSDVWKKEVLDSFVDKDEIPNWAKDAYISDILNNIYVNYPVSNELNPQEDLTRAEAAVLLVKIQNALNGYKTAYLPKKSASGEDDYDSDADNKVVPVYVGTNTLEEMKNSFENKVELYDTKKVIMAGNIVPVKALQKIDSRKVNEGDILTYVSPKDVYSVEGTKLYPEGTKFEAYVDRTQKSYWRKKQNKAYIVFNKAILTDGTEFPIAGVLYSTYKGKVVSEKDKNSKKVQKDITKKYPQNIAAYKFSSKLVPVIKYSEDAKSSLFMLITGDMIIPEVGL